MSTSDRATTATLERLLALRYAGSDYGIVFQVPDGTGHHKDRTADAMAMSVWPSKGLTLHGFEIKASRSDWTKELDHPEKSAGFIALCDFWWIVAADGIVKPEELGTAWGLLTPTRKKDCLKVRKPATPNPNPAPVGRPFLAALFRTLEKRAPARELEQEIKRQVFSAAYEQGAQSERWKVDSAEDRVKAAKNQLKELQDKVAAFEAASGVKIDKGWRGDHHGEEFKAFLSLINGGADNELADELGRSASRLLTMGERCRRLSQAMRDAATKVSGQEVTAS